MRSDSKGDCEANFELVVEQADRFPPLVETKQTPARATVHVPRFATPGLALRGSRWRRLQPVPNYFAGDGPGGFSTAVRVTPNPRLSSDNGVEPEDSGTYEEVKEAILKEYQVYERA